MRGAAFLLRGLYLVPVLVSFCLPHPRGGKHLDHRLCVTAGSGERPVGYRRALVPRDGAPRVEQAEADQQGDKVQSKQQERGTSHTIDTFSGQWDRTQPSRAGLRGKADAIPSRDAQPGTGS